MKKPVIRTVLLTKKNLPRLTREALVQSQYGRKKLYDSVDWRPLTENDYLIELLKNPPGEIPQMAVLHQLILKNHPYQQDMKYWQLMIRDGLIQVRPNSGRGKKDWQPRPWQPLGIATLTKTFS